MKVPVYRTAYARSARLVRPPLHIALYDADPDLGPRALRMAWKTLCGVLPALYPESGTQGEPGSATCKRCISLHRRLSCPGCSGDANAHTCGLAGLQKQLRIG